MNVDKLTYAQVHEPMYVMEEELLRRNLSLIQGVAKAADVEIILAFKAFALWKTFPIFREYIGATTASSLFEARLAFEEFGSPAHSYSPAYTDNEIREFARMSSHLTFNSLSQYERHHLAARQANPGISFGLRVNPEYSEVETELYNPCAPGTRFGVTYDKLPARLPADIEGFHVHCHCESIAEEFQRSLAEIEKRFSPWFSQLKWINFGGGHLMTRRDYNTRLLVELLQGIHSRYPHLHIILEPGSAFAWQTGPLVAQVVDVVEDKGIRTAVLNVSFTCHMPDCLEMPYMPAVRGAEILDGENFDNEGNADAGSRKALEGTPTGAPAASPYIYRLGGCSCLSGDYLGLWRFDHELQVGENIVFEDMIHYTTVKTTMFNGIGHPSLAFLRSDGELHILRKFTYEDYRNRMD